MTFTARPTIYRGTPMRSRLEGRYARYLDTTGRDWVYEPRAYAGPDGDYLPDFEITGRVPEFVELKGTMDWAEVAMERLEIVRLSIPAAILTVAFGDSPLIIRKRDARWDVIEDRAWWAVARDHAA